MVELDEIRMNFVNHSSSSRTKEAGDSRVFVKLILQRQAIRLVLARRVCIEHHRFRQQTLASHRTSLQRKQLEAIHCGKHIYFSTLILVIVSVTLFQHNLA